jgi:prefoldin subunit 5
MTRIQILNELIESLQEQKNAVQTARYEVEEAFEKRIQEYFKKTFLDVVEEDVVIESSRGAVYFKRMNEQGTYNKEIFTIYLRENHYDKLKEGAYKDVQLNYYTTYADSEFELRRLELLGKVAKFVRESKDVILVDMNELHREFAKIIEEGNYCKAKGVLDDQISKLRADIKDIEKEEIASKIFSEEGIKFSEGVYVRLKFNYEPRISSIKLIDASKSGKKATAVFEFAHGEHTSREENINVEKIIDQVTFYYNKFIQQTSAE